MNENSIKKESYFAVDIAKFVMAFFVISIHTCYKFFGSNIADTFVSHFLIRLAVPFFFVASGFFFFRGIVFENGKIKKCPENRSKLFTFLKRTTSLYLIWAVIYFIWEICSLYLSGNLNVSSINIFVSHFIFQGFVTQFWYLLYLIYTIIMLYIILRFVNYKIFCVIPVVLLFILMYQRIYCHIFPLDMLQNVCQKLSQITLFGETILFGPPLYSAIVSVYGGLVAVRFKERLSSKNIIVGLVCSAALLLAEAYFIKWQAPDKIVSYLFFSVPVVMFLFLFLSNISLDGNQKTFSFLRNSSSFIYCFHYLPLLIVNLFTQNTFAEKPVLFLIISGISLVAAFIIVPLSGKLKFLKKLY